MINTNNNINKPPICYYDKGSGELTPLYPLISPDSKHFSTFLSRVKRMMLRNSFCRDTLEKIFKITDYASISVTQGTCLLRVKLRITGHPVIPESYFLLFQIGHKDYRFKEIVHDFRTIDQEVKFSDEEIESELIDFLVDYTPYELEELVDLVD